MRAEQELCQMRCFADTKKHECFKPCCEYCGENKEVGHLCYMRPLANILPSSDDVLFVFYDFETTQDSKFTDSATMHVPNLLCLQQFCSLCETKPDINTDCTRCGKRKHSFFEDPVDDVLSYLCEPRPWCKNVVAIAHNAKAFDAQFIQNRAILLKWKPKLIMKGLKFVSMGIEHMHLLDSASYLPMPLRKLPEAFGLAVTKSWYPHSFNSSANLDYIGPMPDIAYFGADEMKESERREFMTWYEERRDEAFDKRRVLEQYCQDDVTVLREACRIFRRD